MRENYDELQRKCQEAAKQPVLTVAALNEIFKSDMDDWEMPRSKDTEEYDEEDDYDDDEDISADD